jgi:hypothetical protein
MERAFLALSQGDDQKAEELMAEAVRSFLLPRTSR